jgi:hypothetical protein
LTIIALKSELLLADQGETPGKFPAGTSELGVLRLRDSSASERLTALRMTELSGCFDVRIESYPL